MKRFWILLGIFGLVFGLMACEQMGSTVFVSTTSTRTSNLPPTSFSVSSSSSSMSSATTTTIPATSSATNSFSSSSTTSPTLSTMTTTSLSTTTSILTTTKIIDTVLPPVNDVCDQVTFEPDETVYERVTNVVGEYDRQALLIAVGATVCIDVATQFASSGLIYDRYELYSVDDQIASVSDNLLLGVSQGFVSIVAIFYNQSEELRTIVTIATVRVIDYDHLIEIHTAEDLAAMNENRAGYYILKSNIDLSEYGDWQPIGRFPKGNEFTGVLINPDGYKITNLTISSANAIPEGTFGGKQAGLFGAIVNAYIEGIILENVFINISDYEAETKTALAGGIAASTSSSVIRNCYVSGYIIAQYFVGGIVGSNSWGIIEHCYFFGHVEAIDTGIKPNLDMGAGGIVGYSYHSSPQGRVVNCHATGTVIGAVTAGGVIGSYVLGPVRDCTFAGLVIGTIHSGEIVGLARYGIIE